MGARIIYTFPFLRELYSFVGMEGSPENFSNAIRDGKSIFVVPGGVPEMILSLPGNEMKILTTHTGFIKLGLQFGLVGFVFLYNTTILMMTMWWCIPKAN